MLIFVERRVETGHEHLFGLGCRSTETQGLERADLRNHPDDECEKARLESRLLIVLSPFLLIAGLREVVEKFPLRDSWQVPLDVVLLEDPCDFRRFGNDGADSVAVRADDIVEVAEKRPERHGVDFLKGALQQGCGHLETNEIMIIVRRVPLLGDLEDVKAEFRSQMRSRIVFVGRHVGVLLAERGIEYRHSPVHGHSMAVAIRGVVRQSAERECVFIQVLRIADQRLDEVAAANVVHQIAEEMTAVRIIAQVLNDRAAKGEAMSLAQFVGSGVWKALEEQRTNAGIPSSINEGFVRENRITMNLGKKTYKQQHNKNSDGRSNHQGLNRSEKRKS